MCYDYSDSVDKSWKFNENIDKVVHEGNSFVCDYSSIMETILDDTGRKQNFSLPIASSYVDNGNYVNISDWAWRRRDGKDKFSFDSEAEREWANILKDLTSKNLKDSPLRIVKEVVTGKKNPNAGRITMFGVEPDKVNATNKFLWGKNYISNSDIKFEYYLDGVHTSYPDFVMKDSFDRIHLFEVKSVNISGMLPSAFDSEKYKLKVEELKKCYKQASLLTGHIFYLPVLKDDEWFITQLYNGEEKNLTKEQFVDFIMTK